MAALILPIFLLLSSVAVNCRAFINRGSVHRLSNKRSGQSSSRCTKLQGYHQWRELNANLESIPLRLLPFPAHEALSIGENRSIVLKEGRFFDLLQDAVDENESVLGMALMGDDVLLPTVVLCEIQSLDVDAGFRGRVTVEATLKAVGRATIIELLQMKPTMEANCCVMQDDDDGRHEDSTTVRKEIEMLVHELGLEEEFEASCNCITQERLGGHLDATGWAVFSVLGSGRHSLLDALESTNPHERLQLSAYDLNNLKEKNRSFDSNTPFQ